MDNTTKASKITKLGTPLLLYGRTTGVCLKQIDEVTFRISLGDAGVNWTDDIHIDKIEIKANGFR